MPLLFVFFAVILIIIIIARLASKSRPAEEIALSKKSKGIYSVKKVENHKNDNVIEALMNVLVKKGLLTEEEILAELKSVIAEKKREDSSNEAG